MRIPWRQLFTGVLANGLLYATCDTRGADWPQWRYDEMRSAASPEVLPRVVHLQWSRTYPPLQPAWPDEPRQQIDGVYRPIVVGKTLVFGSSQADCVVALDTETGEEKWRFYASGPVRFAPAAWNNRIYVGSDDGYLYCLWAQDGRVLWKFRGGPSNRKVIGHERLISAWAISGGPVLSDGKVYFAAGIWPFEGVFLYCLDTKSGQVEWVNDSTGFRYSEQPHAGAESFSGPTPQGYIVVAGDRLLVPCGRALPACFDRLSGKLLYFHAETHKGSQLEYGPHVSAMPPYFFCGHVVNQIETGRSVVSLRSRPVHRGSVAVDCSGAYDLSKISVGDMGASAPLLWTLSVPQAEVRLWAGNTIYATAGTKIVALEPAGRHATRIVWETEVGELPAEIIAADRKLFVVTTNGAIKCFGERPIKGVESPPLPAPKSPAVTSYDSLADRLIHAGCSEGWAIMIGAGDGALAEALLQRLTHRIDIIDDRRQVIEALRRKWDSPENRFYGTRVSILDDDLQNPGLPPFVAGLLICADTSLFAKNGSPATVTNIIERLFQSVRPYGGALCIRPPNAENLSPAALEAWGISLKQKERL